MIARARSTFAAASASAMAIALAIVCASHDAHAQACCAGAGVVTPGRLALHEDALVGVVARAGIVTGSYASDASRYAANPTGASELDLEQDIFAAIRLFDRAQLALLVPLIETRRTAGTGSTATSGFGGGIGDVNASARYDFTLAGASRVVPGIALLAGLTLPTGRPSDSRSAGTLAAASTGIGAFQANIGLALEQAFGPWLVGVSGIYAQRTARTVGSGASEVHERLAGQWTTLAVLAYIFPKDIALAGSFAYTFEGDATIDGASATNTDRRLPVLSLSGVLPLSDVWRVQAAVFDDLPVGGLGLGQPAAAGLSLTLVRSWI